MNIPWYKKLAYLILAPFVITAWAITHPKQIWDEAKKEFKDEWYD